MTAIQRKQLDFAEERYENNKNDTEQRQRERSHAESFQHHKRTNKRTHVIIDSPRHTDRQSVATPQSIERLVGH